MRNKKQKNRPSYVKLSLHKCVILGGTWNQHPMNTTGKSNASTPVPRFIMVA